LVTSPAIILLLLFFFFLLFFAFAFGCVLSFGVGVICMDDKHIIDTIPITTSSAAQEIF
jgi:hypothetical protein